MRKQIKSHLELLGRHLQKKLIQRLNKYYNNYKKYHKNLNMSKILNK